VGERERSKYVPMYVMCQAKGTVWRRQKYHIHPGNNKTL